MKTEQLSDATLDFWVARAEGLSVRNDGEVCWVAQDHGQEILWRPSRDWSQAGPIIEREWISLSWSGVHHTYSGGDHRSIMRGRPNFVATGKTQLEAAMRAFVAGKIGTEIPH